MKISHASEACNKALAELAERVAGIRDFDKLDRVLGSLALKNEPNMKRGFDFKRQLGLTSDELRSILLKLESRQWITIDGSIYNDIDHVHFWPPYSRFPQINLAKSMTGLLKDLSSSSQPYWGAGSFAKFKQMVTTLGRGLGIQRGSLFRKSLDISTGDFAILISKLEANHWIAVGAPESDIDRIVFSVLPSSTAYITAFRDFLNQ